MPFMQAAFFLLAPILALGAVTFAVTTPPSAPAEAAALDDREPPSQPTDLDAVTGPGGTVLLSWSPSVDEVGLRGYTIYRDGAQIGTSTMTKFVDRNVVEGRHTYSVEAMDDAGNVSQRSRAITADVP